MASKIVYDRNVGFPEIIPNPESNAWATFCPLRSPEFKVHSSKGLAHSALAYRALREKFALYELVDGHWVKRLEYGPPEECPQCGKEKPYAWEMLEEGPRVWQGGIPVCRDCKNKEQEQKRQWYMQEVKHREFLKLKAEFEPTT